MTFRIGNGFDAHKFSDDNDENNSIVLGGVSIPYERSIEAHSDGDVVLHALCDSILGALGKGDIGKHFPDNSDEYKNIDSRILVRHVVVLMKADDYKIQNVDITVIAQAPKMAPHISEMKKLIATDLQTDKSNINVKATTTEGMGFTGRAEGIAVQVSVLLKQNK